MRTGTAATARKQGSEVGERTVQVMMSPDAWQAFNTLTSVKLLAEAWADDGCPAITHVLMTERAAKSARDQLQAAARRRYLPQSIRHSTWGDPREAIQQAIGEVQNALMGSPTWSDEAGR